MKFILPAPMANPAIEKLFKAIPQSDDCLRFVGGCVRDAILGHSVQDMDFATSLTPEEITKYLQGAGIKVLPTGIDHGTITAIIDKHPFEITTLRRDVTTDGRRATVAFTKAWEEDAQRRDFTFNALYADRAGNVTDYFQGLGDLEAGIVRFIGNPNERIQEDYLRILRFFRFYARFGKVPPHKDTLNALQTNAPGLEQISHERIAKEMLLLLNTADPMPALELLVHLKIDPFCFGEKVELFRLKQLMDHEKHFDLSPEPLARLSALLPSTVKAHQSLATFLKLSKVQGIFLQNLARLRHGPHLLMNEALYHYGPILTSWAVMLRESNPHKVGPLLHACQIWEDKVFPLNGNDFQSMGCTGQAIGHAMKQTIAWWIGENFIPDRKACLAKAKRICEVP